jgi:hypothetical protein
MVWFDKEGSTARKELKTFVKTKKTGDTSHIPIGPKPI